MKMREKIEDLLGRNARLEAENERLQKVITDSVIPALIQATDAMHSSAQVLREVNAKREEEQGDDGSAGVPARV